MLTIIIGFLIATPFASFTVKSLTPRSGQSEHDPTTTATPAEKWCLSTCYDYYDFQFH